MKILKHVSSVLLIALFIVLAFGSLFEDKDKEKEYKPEDDGSIRISAENLYKEYSLRKLLLCLRFPLAILLFHWYQVQ